MSQKIVTSLWFDGDAEEAAAFYCSVFKNSQVLSTTRYPKTEHGVEGAVMTVEWELDGVRFVGINGGPQFPFTEAMSLQVRCADQAEVDRVWEALTDGGEEGPCGWCKDRFGVSWQVAPDGLDSVYAGADPAAAQRVFDAMQTMRKLDLAALEAARAG